MRGGVAPRSDGEGDVRERRGRQQGTDPDFPDAIPGANAEGRGDGLPCGASVDVREFEGDAKAPTAQPAMQSSQVTEIPSRRY